MRIPPKFRALLPAVAALIGIAMPHVCAADVGLPALTVQGGAAGGQTYTLTLQVLVLMTALSLLPAILLMMTAFTRIVIVLGPAAPGHRRRADAAQPGAGRPVAVSHPVRDGPRGRSHQ